MAGLRLGAGLGLSARNKGGGGLPVPPQGFALLIDEDGFYLVDEDNNYLFGEVLQ